ncbi:MFS transporter [Mesorhizobium sp. M7A.F.Ca.ET.027.02.1.1]|uniref:MFS transporter n=1 Tax=Mesorhizobium sp. M7A.F.Ca.ET.027.02.1.1 TaxID=2496655 RepID=UPI000FD254A0|nr:MFS transporter [Mesorhizobium sp. M7A.F.Ca.ET.027.02.1.1]RVD12828.1 MFS transporter [Mesorhizobium sp. M7A.F.Ca.ET.027.02.1.1]
MTAIALETGQEARRTALILAASQAIIGSAAPIAISVGALAGQYLLGPDKSLATAPITGFNIGVALGALPAAAIVRSMGQRSGFMTGTIVTALGGLIASLALFQGGFWLFAFGLLTIGVGGKAELLDEGAADNAPPEFKARAISFVLAGGVVTAILGPQIVIFTRELLPPVMFAGSFISILPLAAVGAIILSFLRLPAKASGKVEIADSDARPLAEIITQPRFVAALFCAVGSYALMSFVMTGAPLAMVGCGLSENDATLGISWHVMAMFAPSFFTGSLIHRFGAERIVATGLILLIGCAIVALSGLALWQFWTSLILLGLGWNFGFIGATAMVAATYRPSEKGKVQGFHDFVLFGSVACASLMSGMVYNAWGWEMLNWMVFPVTVLCFVALGALKLTSLRKAEA